MKLSMMVRRGLLVLTLPVMLVACEEAPLQATAQGGAGSAAAAPAAAAPIAARAIEMTSGKRVALTHTYTLRLPREAVETVQRRHIEECVKLGCTVLSTRLDRYDTRLSASSSVRIAPDRYEAFLTVLTAPPADVTSHAEYAEDKAIAYMDVEKRLDGKLVLRDRLTAMLRDPATKTAADLVAIEKELAQVQGEIESATAQRDYLRTITETMKVDIAYNGVAAQAGGFDLTPVDNALKGFVRTTIGSAASLVSFIASLIPWLPVVALVIWLARAGLRRWKARKSAS